MTRLYAIRSGRMILPLTVRVGKAECVKEFEERMRRPLNRNFERAVPVRIVEIKADATGGPDHARAD